MEPAQDAAFAGAQIHQALETLFSDSLNAEQADITRRLLGIGRDSVVSFDELIDSCGYTRGGATWIVNKTIDRLRWAAQEYGIDDPMVVGCIENLAFLTVPQSNEPPLSQAAVEGEVDLAADLIKQAHDVTHPIPVPIAPGETGPRPKRKKVKKKLAQVALRPKRPGELEMKDVRAMWSEGVGVPLERMPTGFWWVDLNDVRITDEFQEKTGREPTHDELDDARPEWHASHPTIRQNLLPRFGEEMLGEDF